MKILPLDELLNHIQNPKTKECMDEVLSCYYSKNYRSAIVMLYSTVLCDLYYKICELVTTYNDTGANEIKEYVENDWKNNTILTQWENEMPKKCKEKNKILNNDSYSHLLHLKDERNLCAHPVILGTELYRPNASTVQGLIIDMLNGILCKPSFLSKDFFDIFINEIANLSEYHLDENRLIEVIKNRYLDKINNEAEEYELFKKLWKFVFKLKDETCEINRNANKIILTHIYDRNKKYIDGKIQDEASYFGENVSIDNNKCLRAFVHFVNFHTKVYDNMSNDFKTTLKAALENNTHLKGSLLCDVDNPIEYAYSLTDTSAYELNSIVFEYLNCQYGMSEALDFAIRMYGLSALFDDADYNYDYFIQPNLQELTQEQLVKLIDVSNENNQIYYRKKSNKARGEIIDEMMKRDSHFDFTLYPNFYSTDSF